MISYEEVESSLLEAEHNYDTTLSALSRMEPLYIAQIYAMVRQLLGVKAEAARLQLESSSEFIQAVNGKDPALIMPILDEVMEAVRMMHPKMYASIIQKIRET